MPTQIQLHLNSSAANLMRDEHPHMNSSPTWFLNNILPRKIRRNQRLFIRVMNASIPCTFLNCDYYNNSLVYEDEHGIRRITIPEGNYNVQTLGQCLQDILPNIDVAYDTITNHFLFQHASGIPWSFRPESTCQEILGLPQGEEVQSDEEGLIESPLAVNLFPIRTILVLCENLITDNVFDSQQVNRNCLIAVPVTASSNSMIIYENTQSIRSEVDSFENLNTFSLRLLDQDGDPLDLNGAHWSISLLFEIE